ncbi:Acyl-CoA N-acyltransferase [Tylopilus felleus]
MPIFIRPATKEDEAALSKICLETSEAGKSGRDVHNYPSLPGEVYALPYVHIHIPDCVWGFVLVDKPTETSPPSDESVVGYTLGALDSRAFEAATAQTWWPPLREKYAEGSLVSPQPTEADQRYIKSIMNFPAASETQIAFSPAHLHIDILESHQRKGWGKKLIGVAIRHLKEKGLEAVWLGMDPRNMAAAFFYERLGFHTFNGSPTGVLGITVEEWELNGSAEV